MHAKIWFFSIFGQAWQFLGLTFTDLPCWRSVRALWRNTFILYIRSSSVIFGMIASPTYPSSSRVIYLLIPPPYRFLNDVIYGWPLNLASILSFITVLWFCIMYLSLQCMNEIENVNIWISCPCFFPLTVSRVSNYDISYFK